MQNSDICKYVDVFLGNGETDRFFNDGLASKWFYIKALCGNTIPHATLPFGKMSVGAYSGGYPTGYGTHYPNACGGIRKLGDVNMIKGFSHLHQSGTGAIRYYYNYAVVTPFYSGVSEIGKGYAPKNEDARPGYYKVEIQDILCELTVDGGIALHRYTFGTDGGRIAVDFSNNGLSKIFGEDFYSEVKDPCIEIVADNEIVFSGIFSGVKLYFCVLAEGNGIRVNLFEKGAELQGKREIGMEAPFGTVIDFDGNTALLKVGYSTISADCARESVKASQKSFDDAANTAYRIWNEHLSSFEISTDDEQLKQKFYSCLYHSIVKPCDMTGENVLGVKGDTVTDLATFWDQYKTVLPLIYMCYPDMREKIVKGIVNISRTIGKIFCSFGLSDVFPCEEQAKMLGIISLCDAHFMGSENATVEAIEECIKREFKREDFRPFIEDGRFERYTHILDTTDACFCVAEIAKDPNLKKSLLESAKKWRNAYADDALMSEDSKYYEGDRYTYSFRIQKNMEERVALAGGQENFAKMLDSFFGFDGESVKQMTYLDAGDDINNTHYHRFEGFNNECDMETPYAYIFAGRHDRLCEILHECVFRSFGLGRGGLPGNNDSGGLSSLFVWNTIGIFPANGSGEFLIGSPQIEQADIKLASGNKLSIRVNREEKQQIYVDRVEWNGKTVENYRLAMADVMCGGVLQFYMK